MSHYWSFLWLIPVLPLLGALILGALSLGSAGGRNGPSRGLVAVLAVLMPLASFIVTVVASVQLAQSRMPGENTVFTQVLWEWFAAGSMKIGLGLLFDNLSSLMLLFVTGIGTLIVLYSVGYMWSDRGFARFMAYMNLFLFSMTVLVLGDSLPVTFLGWEGVGLCSYLLIGFWHKTPEYNDAARKAFIVNRIGDLGFLLGAFLLMSLTGSFGFIDIANWFQADGNQAAIAAQPWLVGGAALLIFLGCTGKSAQIPLVSWLPDAMAGPTPVSALIHAATMVTAGVFLITRLCDVFVVAPPAVLATVMVVGCLTAVWGAIAGLVQTDIKKALAYSTVSQLGFMFMACGVGAFDVAMFHVFTHAFFKATLFLGAGSVIHGLHHEQDMRRMGGLQKLLPATYTAMALAWAAIIGIPLTAGFWSKEQIFHSLFHAHGLGPVIGMVAVLTALLTAVYMTRLMYLVFWSPSRLSEDTRHHVHEAPFTMLLPVLILGFGSLVAGSLWMPLGPLLLAPMNPDLGPANDLFARILAPVVGHAQQALHGSAVAASSGTATAVVTKFPVGLGAYALPLIGTACALLGWWVARAVWRKGPTGAAEGGLTGFAASWTWLFDRWVNAPVIAATTTLSWILWFVDRAVWGVAWITTLTVRFVGDGYAMVQRPRLRTSLALSASGMALLMAVAFAGSPLAVTALILVAVVVAVAVLALELLS